MADRSAVTSPNRALRVGYRLRWCYLALVVFGAVLWWGMWPGQTFWEVLDTWDSNPVLHAMDMVAFFWGLEEGAGWFSDDAAMTGVWGWPGVRWNWYGVQTARFWAWWSVGAFGVPVLLAGAVVGFVGVRPSSGRRLPAKRRPSWIASSIAAGFGGLSLAGAVLMVLHLADWLEPWIDAATKRFVHPLGLPQSSRHNPGVWSWPPHVVWLIAAGVPPAFAGLWFGVLRREVYWRLERMTRYVGLLALALLVVSLVAGLRRLGPWDTYWEIDLVLWPTVWFSAATALLWAAACRVWLLFKLVRYEQKRAAMMTTSPVCYACDYDLSGSLDGGATRCPECGVAVPAEVLAARAAAVEAETDKSQVT